MGILCARLVCVLLLAPSACHSFVVPAVARLAASPRLAAAHRSGLVLAKSPEADDSDSSEAYSVDWDSALQKELRARAEGNAA